jgi:hypothetical protein
MTNDECVYLTQRDEGYGQYERHGLFCGYYLRWSPKCEGCRFNGENDKDDE